MNRSPEGYAGWVQAWSEVYGLTPQIDACLFGEGMYTGYEKYWTSIQNEPDKPVWITGKPPTAAEIEWVGLYCEDAALCVLDQHQFGPMAEYPPPSRTRRHCRPQTAARGRPD
jgi:hypothetical protein